MIPKRATSVAFFVLVSALLGHASIGLAQDAVYKCGSIITNDAALAKREKCELLEGGAVVTIPSHKRAVEVTKPAATVQKPKPKIAKQNTTSPEQQKRDSDAKAVIESELKKTETQLMDLRKQFSSLSSQTDTERKLAVKQQIARAEADIVSLKRELKR